jgi:hypothetical protein
VGLRLADRLQVAASGDQAGMPVYPLADVLVLLYARHRLNIFALHQLRIGIRLMTIVGSCLHERYTATGAGFFFPPVHVCWMAE